MSGKEGSKIGCEYTVENKKKGVEVDLALFIKEVEKKRFEKKEEGYIKKVLGYFGTNTPIIRRCTPFLEKYIEYIDTDTKIYNLLRERSINLIKEYYTRAVVGEKDLGKFNYFMNNIKDTSLYQRSVNAVSNKFTRKVGKYLITERKKGTLKVNKKYMKPYENLAAHAQKDKFSYDVMNNAKIELLIEGMNRYPGQLEGYLARMKKMECFATPGVGYVNAGNMCAISNYMSIEQGNMLKNQEYKQLKNVASVLGFFSEDQKRQLLTQPVAYKLAVSTVSNIMNQKYLTDRTKKGKVVPIETRSDIRFESLKYIADLVKSYGRAGKDVQEHATNILGSVIQNEEDDGVIEAIINNLHTVASEYSSYGNMFNAILKKQLSHALGKRKYKSNYDNRLFKELGKSRYLKRYKINRIKKKNAIQLDTKVIANMEHVMMYNRKQVFSGGMGYLFDYSAHDVLMYRNGLSRCVRSTLGYIGNGLSRFDTGANKDQTIKLTASNVAHNMVRALGRAKLSKEEMRRVSDYMTTDVLDGVNGGLCDKIVGSSMTLLKKGSEKSRYLLRNLSLLGEANKKVEAAYKKHASKSFKKLYGQLARGYTDFESLNKVGDEVNTFLKYSGSKVTKEFKEYLGVRIIAGTLNKNVYYNISTLSGDNSRLEGIKKSGIDAYIQDKYQKDALGSLNKEASQYQKNILLNRQVDSMIHFSFF